MEQEIRKIPALSACASKGRIADAPAGCGAVSQYQAVCHGTERNQPDLIAKVPQGAAMQVGITVRTPDARAA